MRAVFLVLCGLLHPLVTVAQGRCNTPDSKPGTCINIKTCPPLVDLLVKDRNNPRAVEFLRKSQCGFEGRDPKVCCPSSSEDDDESRGHESRSAFPNALLPPQCGQSNVSHSRVVGGVPAELGAYPWIAALGYTDQANPNNLRFLCGGALVSTKHVVTAAHCVYNRQDLKAVRLGDLDLSSDRDGAHPVDIPIAHKIVHPRYTSTQLINDIAVLVLRDNVKFTDSIHPICLPVEESIRNKDITRTYPFVAGWGRLSSRGPTSDRLMEVQVPIVSSASCKSAYSQFQRAVIDDRVVCAGYEGGGKDACQGDSGGPLMLPQGKYFYLVGVVSYGYQCAEAGYPGIYTRVTEFLNFITNAMK